jgi:16S rRNA (cytosine1402-N4)-methyltransferase
MNRHAKAPPSNRRLPEAQPFVPTLQLHGGAIKADGAELALNPRARSAVLRVAEKLGIGNRESGIGKGESKSSLPGADGFRAQATGSSPFPILHSPFPPAHEALHRSAP